MSSKFLSATEFYLNRLNKQYDPIVVMSTVEFENQLENLAFDESLDVKTLILPEGVTLSDPRLAAAKTVSGKSYFLPLGEKFITPRHPYAADIDRELVPPAQGPNVKTEARYQVLSSNRIPYALEAAKLSVLKQDVGQVDNRKTLTRDSTLTDHTTEEPSKKKGLFGKLFKFG